MLPQYSPVTQALLGTLLTWGLTAAGSAMVFLLRGPQERLLASSLGFAAGVMVAASFWSLLAPAIDMASESGLYGTDGAWAFAPVAAGFLLGGGFVFLCDHLLGDADPLTLLTGSRPLPLVSHGKTHSKKDDDYRPVYPHSHSWWSPPGSNFGLRETANYTALDFGGELKQRHSSPRLPPAQAQEGRGEQWRRIVLLLVAITVHNIPEGLAVGVGFGAVGLTASATFEKAKYLAWGIGIQNFPEGLAVSLPLRAAGMSPLRAFWYGQLSGVVEPVAGVAGAALVWLWRPVLPWALAFAAGAMIAVVVDGILPEAAQGGHGRLASYWCMVGFTVMMCLDVGLG